jgi:putative protein-disulfide isomerase
MAKLIYVHDPMCSWCWGYAPAWNKLKKALPSTIDLEYRIGGLAPDCHEPMAESMQAMLKGTWKKIEGYLGTHFNYDFWTVCQPRRSTYPACRAALLARMYNKEQQMILAIQQAYYLNAQNPSDEAVLANIGEKMGLGNATEFKQQLLSEKVNAELIDELAFIRTLPVQGFPSLVLKHDNKLFAIKINYTNHLATLDEINAIINAA